MRLPLALAVLGCLNVNAFADAESLMPPSRSLVSEGPQVAICNYGSDKVLRLSHSSTRKLTAGACYVAHVRSPGAATPGAGLRRIGPRVAELTWNGALVARIDAETAGTGVGGAAASVTIERVRSARIVPAPAAPFDLGRCSCDADGVFLSMGDSLHVSFATAALCMASRADLRPCPLDPRIP